MLTATWIQLKVVFCLDLPVAYLVFAGTNQVKSLWSKQAIVSENRLFQEKVWVKKKVRPLMSVEPATLRYFSGIFHVFFSYNQVKITDIYLVFLPGIYQVYTSYIPGIYQVKITVIFQL